LDKGQRIGTRYFNFAHVRNIEEACGLTNSHVLFNDARVLDRHIPTAKIDHPRTKLAMHLIQWGFSHWLLLKKKF
jgi:hypothetical protein